MVNRHRGEIEAVLDGKSYRLCLTLGALAELEHAFGEDDMLAVAERFEQGRIAAKDAIRIIGAGLRGAGYDFDDGCGVDAERGRRSRLRRHRGAAASRHLHHRRGGESRPFGGAGGAGVRSEPFPWAAAMEAGLGTLRLAPPVFWAMTPRELDAALRGAFGVADREAPMRRDELVTLMATYPDHLGLDILSTTTNYAPKH